MKNDENMSERTDINKNEYLPIITDYVSREEVNSVTPTQKMRIYYIGCAVAVVLCLIVVVWLFLSGAKNRGVPENPMTDTDTQSLQSEWKGAFAEQKIYEACLETAVTVRIEMGSGDSFWSGFVYSADGYIITSSSLLDREKCGRMYVVLNDGSRYAVQSITENKEYRLAMLKIDAKDLVAVRRRNDAMQCGEKIISFSASKDNSSMIISGEVALLEGERMRVNLPSDISANGAPVFDENGCFVGVLSVDKDENEKLECTVYASENIEKIFKISANEN